MKRLEPPSSLRGLCILAATQPTTPLKASPSFPGASGVGRNHGASTKHCLGMSRRGGHWVAPMVAQRKIIQTS